MASWIVNLASQTMSFIATICIYVIYIVIVYTVLLTCSEGTYSGCKSSLVLFFCFDSFLQCTSTENLNQRKLCSLIKDLILFIMNILPGIMKHIPLCYCYGSSKRIAALETKMEAKSRKDILFGLPRGSIFFY